CVHLWCYNTFCCRFMRSMSVFEQNMFTFFGNRYRSKRRLSSGHVFSVALKYFSLRVKWCHWITDALIEQFDLCIHNDFRVDDDEVRVLVVKSVTRELTFVGVDD